jgi:hypothetical protein
MKQNDDKERVMMNTSSAITNQAIKDGYTECFKVTGQGLYAPSNDTYYKAEDLNITNFYRFEGESDPGDSSILYLVETNDGIKGTLLDAYGTYADKDISSFMFQVEEIVKKKSHK